MSVSNREAIVSILEKRTGDQRWGTCGEIADEILAAAAPNVDLLAALKRAQHAMVTTHNYRATDLDVETFEAHLNNGVPRDRLEFMTDFTAELAAIDAAIAKFEEQGK